MTHKYGSSKTKSGSAGPVSPRQLPCDDGRVNEAQRSSLFEVRHWVVTRASGLEGGFLIDGDDRLMTANFALGNQGARLLQLRWRSSSEVVRLAPTESGFVVSSIVHEADDLSVTRAPRGIDARRSHVFGLLDPGTEVIVDMDGTDASVVLQQADSQDVSLDLTAWNVPFASREALTVHDIAGFRPIDREQARGLQQAAFARDGATNKIVFTRFKDGGREFFEIVWNRTGFDVVGEFESTRPQGNWPDEIVPIPDFSDTPIETGDAFSVIVSEDHTVDFLNTTKGWDYRLAPV